MASGLCLDIDVSDLLHGLVDSLMEKGFVEFAAAAMLTIIARVALPGSKAELKSMSQNSYGSDHLRNKHNKANVYVLS